MTFLSKTRNLDTYFEKLSTKSNSLRNTTRIVIEQFDRFCISEYKHSSEQVIQELSNLKGAQQEQSVCDVYQSWINWNVKNKLSPKTLKIYFSLLKSYVHYRGIKLTDKDIKASVNLPKIIREEKHPLKISQIHEILKIASYNKRSLYLALLSSGMKIGEAIHIRKKDLDLTQDRIAINIPARITKTKTGRTAYISKEASTLLRGKLKRIEDDDYVWATNGHSNTSLKAETSAFARYIDKLGLRIDMIQVHER